MADGLRWPAALEGACYTREDGWFRPFRQSDGRILRTPVPADEIADAGLPEHPELDEWTKMLILNSQPLQNLISRRQP